MQIILVANRKGGCGKTMVAITLASALAARGERVALADADPQRSSLRWLKQRPGAAPTIRAVDWRDDGDLGEVPRKTGWLVIDAPGAVGGARAERLVGEAHAVVVPVLPSYFDADATRRFLREIEALKRVRKGRATVHLLANRVRPQGRATGRLQAFFDALGQAPVAWIAERAAYSELAERGLSIFDARTQRDAPLRAQWQPVLDAID